MKKRNLLILLAGIAGAAFAAVPERHKTVALTGASDFISGVEPVNVAEGTDASPWAQSLIKAAAAQVGVTLIYDGAYRKLDYPAGDFDRTRGVCTDVIIRALRDAHGVDLQRLVHQDMARAFGLYPQNWGLTRPDRNIDHRRVPNLGAYFTRLGTQMPPTTDPSAFAPGDIVTWALGPGLPHIGIVTGTTHPDTGNPMIVHNVGAGTRIEDFLFRYPITGQYRIEGKI